MSGSCPKTWVSAPVAVQTFIYQEAALLNNSAFEEWLTLYSEDGSYWMPADADQEDAQDHVSLINDTQPMMAIRVKRLRHPQLYSQQPLTRTLRVVSNILIDPELTSVSDSGKRKVVRSDFICMSHRLRHTNVLAGSYEHHLREARGGLLIEKKIVRLINCDVPLSNVGIPL